MKVLSLFDGLAAAYIALERSGIKVDKYFASEINKYAIAVAKKNYSDIIQLGNIKNISYSNGILRRYEILGNSFTVEVISHILNHHI